MTNLDKQLIDRRLASIRDYLDKLEELRGLDLKTYLSDYRNYASAEHYMQLSIESILDILRHLVIALALRTPDDSFGLFPLLEKAGVLSKKLVDRNLQMPGFRNRLVHDYDKIDHEKTYVYLREHLGDLQEFAKQISQFLLKQKP